MRGIVSADVHGTEHKPKFSPDLHKTAASMNKKPVGFELSSNMYMYLATIFILSNYLCHYLLIVATNF